MRERGGEEEELKQRDVNINRKETATHTQKKQVKRRDRESEREHITLPSSMLGIELERMKLPLAIKCLQPCFL